MTQFAFVFPGQGSQAVGMLSGLAEQYPVIEATFREASDALGYDLGAYGNSRAAKRQHCWPVTAWVNTLRWFAPG